MRVDRKLIFDAAKRRGAVFRTRADVADMDAAIDAAFAEPAPQPAPQPAQPARRWISPKGIALIHSFEQCKLEAYPDPGSKDGHPWTIGWGSTGEGIHRGVRWTQAQADERFEKDIAKFVQGVDALLGDAPTNQNQFDAMCSLVYNIGFGRGKRGDKDFIPGFRNSTVLRKHKAGDYEGAARAFLMWNKNDGKVMKGLTRRRLAESDLYDDPV